MSIYKTIRVEQQCETCGGRGYLTVGAECSVCHGTGHIMVLRRASQAAVQKAGMAQKKLSRQERARRPTFQDESGSPAVGEGFLDEDEQ